MNEVAAATTLSTRTAGRRVTEWEAACILGRPGSTLHTPPAPTAGTAAHPERQHELVA